MSRCLIKQDCFTSYVFDHDATIEFLLPFAQIRHLIDICDEGSEVKCLYPVGDNKFEFSIREGIKQESITVIELEVYNVVHN